MLCSSPDWLRLIALCDGWPSWRDGLSRRHGVRSVSRDRDARATALLLNIVAASYATWRLHRRAAIDRKMLLPLTVPSLVAVFLGGLLVLGGHAYFILTGLLLVAAAVLMVFKQTADTATARPVRLGPAAAVGAGAGFISGLTGVGGGVFLTPVLIALGWATPKRAAQLSPPFILCNSILGLAGVLLAGQQPAPGKDSREHSSMPFISSRSSG
jgi:uncharacterized protein